MTHMNDTQPIVGPPTPTPKKARAHRLFAGRLAMASYAGLVALITGVAIGQGAPPAPVASEAPAPSPTVTVTAKARAAAPAPAETVKVSVPGPTVTKTVTKAVTPAACAKALDQADRMEEAFQWETNWIVDYLGAVGDFDVDKMTKMNGEISSKTDKYAGVIPAYESLAAACRK